jgi:hypothetical protein
MSDTSLKDLANLFSCTFALDIVVTKNMKRGQGLAGLDVHRCRNRINWGSNTQHLYTAALCD